MLKIVISMSNLFKGRAGLRRAFIRWWSVIRLARSLPPKKMTTTSRGMVKWWGMGWWCVGWKIWLYICCALRPLRASTLAISRIRWSNGARFGERTSGLRGRVIRQCDEPIMRLVRDVCACGWRSWMWRGVWLMGGGGGMGEGGGCVLGHDLKRKE